MSIQNKSPSIPIQTTLIIVKTNINKKWGTPTSPFKINQNKMLINLSKDGELYRMKMNLIIGLYYRLLRLK